MGFRNPEQSFIVENTRQEAPLTHRENSIVDALLPLQQNEKNPAKLSLMNMMRQRSPASDQYTQAEVIQDAGLLAEDRELSGTSGRTERANILEQVILRDSAAFGWFGNPELTHVIGTTEYDDRKNFVDAVIAFQRKDGATGYLAIDLVAAGFDSGSLSKKRTGCERLIAASSLYSVKYLPERIENGQPVVRRIESVPRVVIGMDPSTLIELSEHLYGYYCPEAALKENRGKLGLKAYQQEHPQTPQAMKEKARQDLASHPIAYEIAQEVFAQLESQALLALNVFLDRSANALKEDAGLRPHLEKLRELAGAISEYRAYFNVDPTQVKREEAVAALERTLQLLPELEPLEAVTGYPIRALTRKLFPFVKYFGNLATKRQALYDPKKEDPTIKALTRPWETDPMTRRHLAAAA